MVGEQRFYPFDETRFTRGIMYTDQLLTGQREIMPCRSRLERDDFSPLSVSRCPLRGLCKRDLLRMENDAGWE